MKDLHSVFGEGAPGDLPPMDNKWDNWFTSPDRSIPYNQDEGSRKKRRKAIKKGK
jgi:hypothetical protein